MYKRYLKIKLFGNNEPDINIGINFCIFRYGFMIDLYFISYNFGIVIMLHPKSKTNIK